MRFSRKLEESAHRSGEEYAWQRADALQAADALAQEGCAILGGELWLVQGRTVWGALPQHSGPPAVYHWASERLPDETWASFVERSRSEAHEAIHALPGEGELALPTGSRIYYNLTWVNEHEYLDLARAAEHE